MWIVRTVVVAFMTRRFACMIVVVIMSFVSVIVVVIMAVMRFVSMIFVVIMVVMRLICVIVVVIFVLMIIVIMRFEQSAFSEFQFNGAIGLKHCRQACIWC